MTSQKDMTFLSPQRHSPSMQATTPEPSSTGTSVAAYVTNVPSVPPGRSRPWRDLDQVGLPSNREHACRAVTSSHLELAHELAQLAAHPGDLASGLVAQRDPCGGVVGRAPRPRCWRRCRRCQSGRTGTLASPECLSARARFLRATARECAPLEGILCSVDS